MRYWKNYCCWFLAGFLFLGCRVLDSPATDKNKARLAFIDVGQGDAIFIQNGSGESGLVDAGPANGQSLKWLEENSIKRLNWIIISHADFDHYGGALEIIQNIKVERLYLPLDSNPYPSWENLLKTLKEKKIPVDSLFQGENIRLLNSVEARVLWPPPTEKLEGNASSYVLDLSLRGVQMLLTGDIDFAIEEKLLPLLANQKNYHVLKLAHHGSSGSSSSIFLSKVQPKWVVASCDSSVYGHPAPETLERIYAVVKDSSQVLRTDKNGSLEFLISEQGTPNLQ